MLQILKSAYDSLRQHSEAAYPNECCGILLGQSSPGMRIVTQAIPVPNTSSTPKNHYEIAPLDLIRIQKAAHQSGEEILGFYHSHPDHPAAPSQTDLAEAHWLSCSYVITSIRNGHASQTNSFRLEGASEDAKYFLNEEIDVTASQ
jgi:proteasome lid subunit RPN8/RPN11